jgi:hypothetical protein
MPMARPKKARIEDSEPVSSFESFVERFKAERPTLWDEIRLCPLQHGLEAMIHALGAKD